MYTCIHYSLINKDFEAYKSGAALLYHQKNVDGPLNIEHSALKFASLTRLEFYGPKSEIEVVREALTS